MMRGSKVENAQDKTVYPDKTTFYDYNEARRVFSTLKPRKFTVTDSILLLLYAQPDKPVFGRVLLIKEIFLLINEVLNIDDVQDANWVPYRFGMYSFTIGNTLPNLEYSGYVERKGKKNARLEQFTLTSKGKDHTSEIWKSLPVETQEILKAKRKGWDQLGYDGILRLVYIKYPEYTEKSCLRERYKAIPWGRGTG